MITKKDTVLVNLPLSKSELYKPWIKGKSKESIEEGLKAAFSDTLDNLKDPQGGIVIGLLNNYAVGIPYSINDERLRVGQYANHDLAQMPGEVYIPLENILAFKRFELPNVLTSPNFKF